jgi:hypothetical protein
VFKWETVLSAGDEYDASTHSIIHHGEHMPIKRTEQPMTARWKNRRTIADDAPPGPVPVVRVQEQKELPGQELVNALRDMPPRQWQATLQLLIEAKFKAESMLRDEKVISNPSQLAYYTGWVTYSDFVLASFEGLRAGNTAGRPEQEED